MVDDINTTNEKDFTLIHFAFAQIATAEDVVPGPNAYHTGTSLTKPSAGPKLKSRMSPFVTVFVSNRVDTLRVKV